MCFVNEILGFLVTCMFFFLVAVGFVCGKVIDIVSSVVST